MRGCVQVPEEKRREKRKFKQKRERAHTSEEKCLFLEISIFDICHLSKVKKKCVRIKYVCVFFLFSSFI